MNTTALLSQLRQLHLSAMAEALARQQTQPQRYLELAFEERLQLLLEQEFTARLNRRHERLIKAARFRLAAHIGQFDDRQERGLSSAQLRELAQGHWLTHHQNLLVTGATGCGKSWFACAIGHHLCHQGIAVRYFRTRSLLEALRIAQADGSYPRLLTQLAAVPLLILDDWGLEGMSLAQRSDLLDLLDARHGTAATLIASQLPVEKWYEVIGEATFADAILDRLIHRALRIELKGESMRRRQSGEEG